MDIYYFNSRTKKFREGLDEHIRQHVIESFKELEEKSYTLGLPASRALGRGLFELRIIDMTHIRFIYTFHTGKIWVLHGFIKKSDHIVKSDIDYARDQLKMLLYEYNR